MTDYRALVAALRHCCNHGGCNACPAYEGHKCHEPMRMAADAIEELMAEIEHIRQTSVSHEVYQMVCSERDAAVRRDTCVPPISAKRIPGIGKCAICKTKLCIDDEELFFCPTCGQRLKRGDWCKKRKGESNGTTD